MNERLTIQMEHSLGMVVYNQVNFEQRRSKYRAVTTTKFFVLVQELKEMRKELRQVRKKRDVLRMEVLNCIQII